MDKLFQPKKKCSCGSRLDRFVLADARGIFCAFVCDECIQKVMSKYRPEIFTDSDYWADEPIEGDD